MTRLYPYNKLPITAIAEVKNIDKNFIEIDRADKIKAGIHYVLLHGFSTILV